MTIAALPAGLAAGSGGLIGLVLGLIGGGGSILAMPLLIYTVGMASPHAAFGIAAASNYAWSGFVDWPIAALLIAGGAAGAVAGTRLNAVLSRRKDMMARIFAGFVIAAGLYVSIRGLATLVA